MQIIEYLDDEKALEAHLEDCRKQKKCVHAQHPEQHFDASNDRFKLNNSK